MNEETRPNNYRLFCSCSCRMRWPTLFHLYETDGMKLTSQMMTHVCYSNLKVNR